MTADEAGSVAGPAGIRLPTTAIPSSGVTATKYGCLPHDAPRTLAAGLEIDDRDRVQSIIADDNQTLLRAPPPPRPAWARRKTAGALPLFSRPPRPPCRRHTPQTTTLSSACHATPMGLPRNSISRATRPICASSRYNRPACPIRDRQRPAVRCEGQIERRTIRLLFRADDQPRKRHRAQQHESQPEYVRPLCRKDKTHGFSPGTGLSRSTPVGFFGSISGGH